MAIVSLELADEDVQILGGDSEAVGKALRLAAALLLCSRGRISTGRAARLAGLTYADFLDEAKRNEVALFDPDLEDLKHELARPLPEEIDVGAIKRDLERARSALTIPVYPGPLPDPSSATMSAEGLLRSLREPP